MAEPQAAQADGELSIGAALALEAKRQTTRIAVECDGRSLTWEALHRRTNRLARALERRGLKHGDFLTIALPNGVEFVEACYGRSAPFRSLCHSACRGPSSTPSSSSPMRRL
jgi:acyl-CoA synthetase (AMP-forming)/AMP-acid ligase II